MPTGDQSHFHPRVLLAADLEPLDVLRRCGRTFYAASRLLPRSVRSDLGVLYAFCRLVDDCGDLADESPHDRSEPLRLLDEVERDLHAERPSSPIIASFRRLADEHAIPPELPHQLIVGVRSDLSPVRMSSRQELIRYAYLVASTVGLMMCRVLRVPREGDPFAIDLGIAMQLTNIARDVREDGERDRVYLPASWIEPDRVLGRLASESDPQGDRPLAEAVEQLLALADRYYESAGLGMRYLPARVRPGIRAAASSYRAIGTVIRRDPLTALRERAATTGLEKTTRSAGALFASAIDAVPIARPPLHDARLHRALAALPGASA